MIPIHYIPSRYRSSCLQTYMEKIVTTVGFQVTSCLVQWGLVTRLDVSITTSTTTNVCHSHRKSDLSPLTRPVYFSYPIFLIVFLTNFSQICYPRNSIFCINIIMCTSDKINKKTISWYTITVMSFDSCIATCVIFGCNPPKRTPIVNFKKDCLV